MVVGMDTDEPAFPMAILTKVNTSSINATDVEFTNGMMDESTTACSAKIRDTDG